MLMLQKTLLGCVIYHVAEASPFNLLPGRNSYINILGGFFFLFVDVQEGNVFLRQNQNPCILLTDCNGGVGLERFGFLCRAWLFSLFLTCVCIFYHIYSTSLHGHLVHSFPCLRNTKIQMFENRENWSIFFSGLRIRLSKSIGSILIICNLQVINYSLKRKLCHRTYFSLGYWFISHFTLSW